MGLRILLQPGEPIQLDPQRLAATLYPTEPRRGATERVILHLLMLEEAGHLHTWAQDGREWLALLDPHEPPPAAPTAPPRPTFTPAPDPLAAGPFSPAGKREKEREDARARARERARARAAAEEQERRERWASWEQEYEQPRPARPVRPSLLDAPPIGCPDHPNGSLTPCGPCGTAFERREAWKAEQKYVEQLSIFEERWGDEPF